MKNHHLRIMKYFVALDAYYVTSLLSNAIKHFSKVVGPCSKNMSFLLQFIDNYYKLIIVRIEINVKIAQWRIGSSV